MRYFSVIVLYLGVNEEMNVCRLRGKRRWLPLCICFVFLVTNVNSCSDIGILSSLLKIFR